VLFEDAPALEGNSDADVLLHALVNAITGVTAVVVLGPRSDELCRAGMTDSAEYVREALKHLAGLRIVHVSCSLECARPKIGPKIGAIRENIAALLGISPMHVALTAHSGEGLTAFGRGEGVAATVLLTAVGA
jgi:2-C-methyl-D-erythritol 2,4-cyclodiphosphate synthase